jgi:hypothetical protein
VEVRVSELEVHAAVNAVLEKDRLGRMSRKRRGWQLPPWRAFAWFGVSLVLMWILYAAKDYLPALAVAFVGGMWLQDGLYRAINKYDPD